MVRCDRIPRLVEWTFTIFFIPPVSTEARSQPATKAHFALGAARKNRRGQCGQSVGFDRFSEQLGAHRRRFTPKCDAANLLPSARKRKTLPAESHVCKSECVSGRQAC